MERLVCMERIPVRELNQHTSAVLARVAGGESLEITVSGRSIARLVPIQGGRSSVVDKLISRGRLVPAMDPSPFTMPAGPVGSEPDSTEVISELREDRL
jgi:prevent-host-death family protein